MVIARISRALVVVVMMATVLSTYAQGTEPGERASVVVTTEVLGAVVSQVVGDAADVSVLMESGADPHTWQPSARDGEAIFGADLIVANGLDLEEGLVDVLEQARAEGVAKFAATDHITVREFDADDHDEGHVDEAGDQADDDGDAHEQGPGDPHFWLDPAAMADVVAALAVTLSGAGIDVDARADEMLDELDALDAEIGEILAAIPDERRTLVTGHESLGYLADRYGLEVVGTVIPGLTTSGEPSARDLAELTARIRETGASAVFAEIGTPQAVAQAVADETGAVVVELRLAQLPEDGRYGSLMRELATTIADALTP